MRLFQILSFYLFTISLTAQSNLHITNWYFMDRTMIPPPGADMPAYVCLLCADQVDMIELEQASNWKNLSI